MKQRPRLRQTPDGAIHIEAGASGHGRCGVDLDSLKKGFARGGHACGVCFEPRKQDTIRLRSRRSR